MESNEVGVSVLGRVKAEDSTWGEVFDLLGILVGEHIPGKR